METLSRKERERLLRKQEIMKVAARLFAEKSFASTTLEEIAAKAEYGTGTIYNYFMNKDELLSSIIESVFESNIALIEKADKEASDLLQFFEIYVRGIFEYFINNKEEILLMARYFVTTPNEDQNKAIYNVHCRLDDLMRKRINDGIKNEEIRYMNPDYLFYYTHSMIYPYITLLIRHNKFLNEDREEHINFLLDLFFNGIKKNPNKETR